MLGGHAHRLALACLLFGCDEAGSAPPAPVEPPPLLPSVTSPAPERDEQPAWYAKLRPAPRDLSPGDSVWATVPSVGPLSRIGVFVVDRVGDSLSLVDRLGQREDQVPPALVHRVAEAGKLAEGDCVLFYAPTTEARLGRVGAVETGKDIQVLHDASGATRSIAVDHVEPPREGLAPLAFVDVPQGDRRSRGIVIARQGDEVFVRVPSGHVEVHPPDRVRPLPLPPEKLTVGDHVRAFRWATGFEEGSVTEVLEKGLRYEVALDGNRPRATYFFSEVLPRRP